MYKLGRGGSGPKIPKDWFWAELGAMARTSTNNLRVVLGPYAHCCPCEALEQNGPKDENLKGHVQIRVVYFGNMLYSAISALWGIICNIQWSTNIVMVKLHVLAIIVTTRAIDSLIGDWDISIWLIYMLNMHVKHFRRTFWVQRMNIMP